MLVNNEILNTKFSKQRFDDIVRYSNSRFLKSDITLDLLYYCRAVMANVVKENGDDYLPIFIRIQNSIAEHEEVEKHKRIALQLVDNTIE